VEFQQDGQWVPIAARDLAQLPQFAEKKKIFGVLPGR
jgi:hypothetical protein